MAINLGVDIFLNIVDFKVGSTILWDSQVAPDHAIFVIFFRGSMPPAP